MKKNIWIFNHYATDMYVNKGGRHYWFAKNLVKNGYNVTIFCASTIHNSENEILVKNNFYEEKEIESIKFVFIKTPKYFGNGKKRIKNMYVFYSKLFSVTKSYLKKNEKPDLILASSVHPLTLVAGIKIAKKYNIKCITEVRDLWPETLVSYGTLNKKSLLTKFLYFGEKTIYKKSDAIIFTMEGGREYIKDKKWDIGNGGKINLDKIYHINNGIDIKLFDYNKDEYIIDDSDIMSNKFKIVYTGSIRRANNLEIILDTAKYIKNKGYNDIIFLIWGDGDEKDYLEEKCDLENISNVIFKGKVKKNYIPYITEHADLNILNYSYYDIWKYGGSQNKYFEYLASGKPVLSTINMGYDILKKYNAGISVEIQNSENIGNSIIYFYNLNKNEYNDFCLRARKAAYDYDFEILTNKLVEIIEKL